MANHNHWKLRKKTLAEQMFSLKRGFPDSICRIEKHKTLVWQGCLCPSPLSNTYPVTLNYSLGSRPKICVSSSNIKKISDPDFPHVFHKDEKTNTVEICLAYGDDFNGGMLLSDTYIPWAIEWLYYYEIWLATGTWNGGGLHPKQK